MPRILLHSLVLSVLTLAVVACEPIQKEYYTSQYTEATGCNWTQITCYAGTSVVYNDRVCRYYLNYGELSVAHSHNEMIRNVLLTRDENCTFQQLS